MQIIGDWLFAEKDFIKTQQTEKNIDPINSVYEVLRIVEGIPLFVDDHYFRLKKSCESLNLEFHSETEIRNILKLLVEKNNLKAGNIKIEYLFFPSGTNLFVYQIPHQYPSEDMYSHGIAVASFQAERPNPNVKQSIINNKIRKLTNKLLVDKNIYEAALINPNREVTEGSRTNIFFVKDADVFSAPRNLILGGITRAKITQIAANSGNKIIEENISIDDLNKYEGCFLTGTSPKVLPVKTFDQIQYDVDHPVIRFFMQKYNEMINDYCNRFNR